MTGTMKVLVEKLPVVPVDQKKWENEIPGTGEFFRQAGNIAGDWKKALLDELVTYYLEGERFSLNVSGISSRRNAEARKKDEQVCKDGFWKTAEKILGEEGPKAIDKQKKYEKLYWFTDLVEGFVDSTVKALWNKPAHTPSPPVLKVRVLRPAMLPKGSFPFDFTVLGDIGDLPASTDDFKLSLKYDKVKEHIGVRPAEVMIDDIKTLYGDQYEDRDFKFIEYKVRFKLEYKGGKDLVLADSQTIFIVDLNKVAVKFKDFLHGVKKQ